MHSTEKLKIGISGASRGLGKAIFDNFSQIHDCTKVASRIENVTEVFAEIENCDVFINNAYNEHHQLKLLDYVYSQWRVQDKLIINIGSRAANPNISKGFIYSTYKNALIHYSNLAIFKDKDKMCRITTINPGLIDSDKMYGLDYMDVVKSINYVLSSGKSTEISRIDLHSSTPYETVQNYKSITGGKWKF